MLPRGRPYGVQLWTERRMSIRAKLVVAIVASMVALAVFTAALVRAAGERNVRIAADQAIAAAAQALAAAERADIEKLDATLHVLAGYPGLVDAFAARDRARLLGAAAPLFASLQAEHHLGHLYFIDREPERTCFLRVHRPEQFGDVIDRATLSRAIETKQFGAGKDLGRNAFALRVVRPWYAPDGRHIGYVELGERMDQFLDRIKTQTGDDYALVVEKALLDEQGWAAARASSGSANGPRRTAVVDTTTTDETIVPVDPDLDSVPDRGLLLDEQVRNERVFARGIVPVKDASGRRVGGLFVLHDITSLQESMMSVRRSMYVAIVAAAAALGTLLLVLANRLVFARLDRMVRTMDDLSARLAGGDYDVVAPRASGTDEIGRFEEIFGRFLQVVTGLLKELSRNRTG